MDQRSPIGLPEPPRRGGGLRWRLVLVAFCVAVLAWAGPDRVRDAALPGSGSELALLAVLLVGFASAVSLLVRMGRGAPPEDPLASRLDEAPTARSVQAPAEPRDDGGVFAGGEGTLDAARRLRRVVRVVGLVGFVLLLVVGVLRVGDTASELGTVDVPSIGTAFEPTCPRPAGGRTALDDARSDCLPLEEATFFETGLTSIQGRSYVGLRAERTDLCRAVLRTSRGIPGCQTVLQGLYATDDELLLASASVLVFETLEQAEAAVPQLDAVSDGVAVRSPATPDDSDLPPRLDQLRPSWACVHAQGRYVLCSVAGATRPGSATRDEEVRALRDLGFLVTDSLLARRFESI